MRRTERSHVHATHAHARTEQCGAAHACTTRAHLPQLLQPLPPQRRRADHALERLCAQQRQLQVRGGRPLLDLLLTLLLALLTLLLLTLLTLLLRLRLRLCLLRLLLLCSRSVIAVERAWVRSAATARAAASIVGPVLSAAIATIHTHVDGAGGSSSGGGGVPC